MSEDRLVSLLNTPIWAIAFIVAIYIISTSFAPLIRRSLDQDASRRRYGD